jgi:enoyl-CoA hydratase/carnithine racemase
MTQSSAVQLEIREHLAELTLNRPEVLNAENWQLANDLHAALDELEKAASVSAVVITGAGRAFCSGIDLKSLAAGEIDLAWFRHTDVAVRRLEQLDALTVAKIRGYAIGGGLQIALACDLRIAENNARFGLPAVLEALIPGMGTYRLPRFIGLGRARRMALTGEMIAAPEALDIGLVDWAVPEEQLASTVASVIEGVLKGSSAARRYTKRLITSSFESPYESAFAQYLDYQQECLRSPDHTQAMSHFRTRKG